MYVEQANIKILQFKLQLNNIHIYHFNQLFILPEVGIPRLDRNRSVPLQQGCRQHFISGKNHKDDWLGKNYNHNIM